MKTGVWRAALALLFAWSFSNSAAAGPLETLRAIAFHPSDPATYAAVFNEAGGGLLITRDGGQSFRLACMSYVTGKSTIDGLLPNALYTSSGHLVVATFRGLFRDDGTGCSFARAQELGDAYVTGLTADPHQPDVLYAMTSSGGQQNAIYRSADQGATWSPFGALEDAFFRRLDIVTMPDGHRRFYVSLARIEDTTSYAVTAALRISDDEGASYVEHVFPHDSDMTLAGVDALLPERVYALAPEPDHSGTKVLLNDAAGAPEGWRELGTVQSPGNFELLPGGGFFLVDVGARQLFRLNDSQDGLVLADAADITCFEQSPLTGERFSCATWSMFEADASGARTDRVIYDMNWLDAVVSCGDQDVVASCVPQFDYGWCGVTHYPEAPLCQELRGEGGAKGCGGQGQPACADAGAEPPASKPKANGCALTPGSTRPRSWVLLAGLACALRARRGRGRSIRA